MTEVYARFQVEAWHCWAEAPLEVDYLRSRHRHMFHFTVYKRVADHDREVEFITLGRRAKGIVQAKVDAGGAETWSCEHWGQFLVESLGLSRCEVSEDGENGAIVDVRGVR